MCKLNDTAEDSIRIRFAIIDLLNGKQLSGKEMHKLLNTADSYNKFTYHINYLASAGIITKVGKQGQNLIYEVLNADYKPTTGENKKIEKPVVKKPLSVWEYMAAAA